MLTTQQVANILNITRSAVLKALKAGALHGEKIGRDWMITPSAVDEYRQYHLGKIGRPKNK